MVVSQPYFTHLMNQGETYPEIIPEIKESGTLKLVGMKKMVSMSTFDLAGLWSNFMTRRREIVNPVSEVLFSLAIYEPDYFQMFEPQRTFEKWAAMEVSEFIEIPSGMSSIEIPAGLYAVFPYKGLSTNRGIYEYIFSSWLPRSTYQLDHRPHFEVLGEKYRNNDPDSEEEIWIPIREMNQ